MTVLLRKVTWFHEAVKEPKKKIKPGNSPNFRVLTMTCGEQTQDADGVRGLTVSRANPVNVLPVRLPCSTRRLRSPKEN